jgi:plasmid stabilization system protein ParE
MADEAVLAFVVGEGHLARAATQDMAAVTALDERTTAAAVQEKDDLLAGIERLADPAGEGTAEDTAVATLELFPEIHDLDRG